MDGDAIPWNVGIIGWILGRFHAVDSGAPGAVVWQVEGPSQGELKILSVWSVFACVGSGQGGGGMEANDRIEKRNLHHDTAAEWSHEGRPPTRMKDDTESGEPD